MVQFGLQMYQKGPKRVKMDQKEEIGLDLPHISDITVGTSRVRHNLDTAVGKVDSVLALGVVVVTALSLAETSSGVSIIDSILVVVHWGEDGLGIRSRGGVVGGGVVSHGQGGGDSQEGSGKSDLKLEKITS